ncbi:unnamed protein product [Nezara viridula]|uniref:Uncharacterized protein n=1 Tax=Nezara viridula TaxID=85310 RepID=A0A9P0ED45_NEZVI|nr:unnamed protein product [Nezara viridula]
MGDLTDIFSVQQTSPLPTFANAIIFSPSNILQHDKGFQLSDLIPRHMHIFRTNDFFTGITLPQPDVIEPLESKLPKQVQNDANLIDFLKKCLDKEPSKRWNAEELLRHRYFDHYHFKIPEPEMEEFEKLKKQRDQKSRNSSSNMINMGGALLPQLGPSPEMARNQNTTQRNHTFHHLPDI